MISKRKLRRRIEELEDDLNWERHEMERYRHHRDLLLGAYPQGMDLLDQHERAKFDPNSEILRGQLERLQQQRDLLLNAYPEGRALLEEREQKGRRG